MDIEARRRESQPGGTAAFETSRWTSGQGTACRIDRRACQRARQQGLIGTVRTPHDAARACDTRCQLPERAMRSTLIVVLTPRLDLLLRVCQETSAGLRGFGQASGGAGLCPVTVRKNWPSSSTYLHCKSREPHMKRQAGLVSSWFNPAQSGLARVRARPPSARSESRSSLDDGL